MNPSCPPTTCTAARRQWRSAPVAALAIACATWLAACSSKPTTPEPAPLPAHSAEIPVGQVWTNRVGAQSEQASTLPLFVTGDAVLVASADGTLARLDAATGRDVWRTHFPGGLLTGAGTDGSVAAVVTQGNQLVVLGEGGHELWRTTLAAATWTTPLVAGQRVFVLGGDRTVSAFDAHNGARLWTYRGTGDALVLRHSGVLMSFGNTLLAGVAGRLLAIHPDNGAVLWETPMAASRGTNDVERMVDLIAPATRSADGLICARAFEASVTCADARRGQVLWRHNDRGHTGLAADEQFIFGVRTDGSIQAFARRDGTRAWSTSALQWRHVSAPLVLGRSVVVGDNAGNVHLIARDDGRFLNRLSTDASGIATAPVAAANTLIVQTRAGAVYGFRPD